MGESFYAELISSAEHSQYPGRDHQAQAAQTLRQLTHGLFIHRHCLAQSETHGQADGKAEKKALPVMLSAQIRKFSDVFS